MGNITRREALARMGARMAMGGLGIKQSTAATSETKALAGASASCTETGSGEPLVIAHITDEHITDAYHSDEWVSKCLQQIQSHPLKPSLILNTGDSVMDSAKTDRETADRLWKIWNTTLKRENSLPVYSVLGNHDVWGMRRPTGDAIYKDPMFGKKLGQDGMGLDKLYYSFDQGNWHFVMLDVVDPVAGEKRGDWIARLGDEQHEWLANDLAKTPADRSVVVCSHVPILQVTSMASAKPTEDGQYVMGPKNMMSDARRIIDLFEKHPNVKVCFSGHTHNRDRVSLGHTTYINAGSVCGSQWRVSEQSPSRPGYSIVTLHPDGNFDYQYENYGWRKAEA